MRELAAFLIGKIGLPEGISAIDNLLKAIHDGKSPIEVKVKSIWAIGRLANACDNNVIIS